MALPIVQSVWCAEIDTTGKVASVHDGDTFTLTTGEKVRLADLNAPELGDEGADEATDYLASLVNGKTVYLDVDDKYQTDSFGRLVCVVYVAHNSSHYLNVNEALISGGYVDARDYNNEFDYRLFDPYMPIVQPDPTHSEGAPFGLIGAVGVVLAAFIVLLMMRGKKK